MCAEEMTVNDGDLWESVGDEELMDDFQSLEEDHSCIPPHSPGSPIHSRLHNFLGLFVALLAKWSAFYNITENSLNSLLKVLGFCFQLLGKLIPPLASFSKMFPWSTYKLNKLCGSSGDDFEKFVVCSICHSIYQYNECFDTVGGRKVPKNCTYIAFPNHPHSSHRKPCNGKLLAEVTLSNGCKRYYPRKVYCYKSVIKSLTTLLEKNGLVEACEHWRQRSLPEDVLGDIYDGRMWKEFQHLDGKPYLSVPHNLALMLNIDWFNPYKHSPYSVGAIYLVILNLPRSERYKIENLLLVGLIPGPSEPPLTMNSYLQPLIEELLQLWDTGITLRMRKQDSIIVKAVLFCVSCDIPAARKVCGFLGHAARLGCSKCTKEFKSEGFGKKMCYAGFESCLLRTEENHRKHAQEALNKTTITGRSEVERENGSRYTALMLLPYFSCVRCHTVDPMHNLYLGTARYMVKNLWVQESSQIIPHHSLLQIQERVDNCDVPSTMGRIPNKIAANFSSFKADQWKTWTLVFSIFALFGLIGRRHLNCWRKFVLACTLLDASIISKNNVEEAHQLLLSFCTDVEELYGPDAVTMNMHLHMHLKDCIYDFGPVASFWVFGFERFNGYLGKYSTNNRSVEIQMMRKFTKDLNYRSLVLPDRLSDEIIHYPNFNFAADSVAGILREMFITHCPLMFELSLLPQKPLLDLQSSRLWAHNDHINFMGCGRKVLMENHELLYLVEVYKMLYNNSSISTANLSKFIIQYKQLESTGQIWGSHNSLTKRSSFVLAAWHGRDGQVDPSATTLRPALVSYYFKHNINFQNSSMQQPQCHIFAFVRWYMPHPSIDLFGKPVQVYCSNLFEMSGPSQFLPFNRIHSQFVAGYYRHQEEKVLCVCPISPKYYV